jgi:segregation and condensation protein B
VLNTLLQRRLVRIAGRKEVVGKPFLYATTREFLVHFGLNRLADLPPLEEFEETFGAAGGVMASLPPPPEEDREESFLREAAALSEEAEAHSAEGEMDDGAAETRAVAGEGDR